MNKTKDQEFEFDLFELLNEFKKNIVLIVGTTALFALAAGIYVHVIVTPNYVFTKIIDCPELNDKGRASFATIFSNDVGYSKKGALTSVVCIRDKNNNSTNLLKFEFTGSDPDYLAKFGNEYAAKSLELINNRIKASYDIKFNKEYLATIKQEITNLNTALKNGVVSTEGANESLNLLKERLELKERNKFSTFIEASIVEPADNAPRKISKPNIILKSSLLGLFLSFSYIFISYIRKKIKG